MDNPVVMFIFSLVMCALMIKQRFYTNFYANDKLILRILSDWYLFCLGMMIGLMIKSILSWYI